MFRSCFQSMRMMRCSREVVTGKAHGAAPGSLPGQAVQRRRRDLSAQPEGKRAHSAHPGVARRSFGSPNFSPRALACALWGRFARADTLKTRPSKLSLPLALLLLMMAFAAPAQPEFPQLTGRVVDRAEMLDEQTESRITQMLASHEQATTEQVVVVTLNDLQGYPIAQYGYQLGREWGIGQEGEDNGALLIVAPNEREVRIEVGYGLEGRLTDAQSSVIINQIITPAFSNGNFAAGITEGVTAMVQVLGGTPLEAPPADERRRSSEQPSLALSSLFVVLFMVIMGFLRGGGRGRGGMGMLMGGALLGAGIGGMGRGASGGFGGGGFGGGGGGFGGGGASGGW